MAGLAQGGASEGSLAGLLFGDPKKAAAGALFNRPELGAVVPGQNMTRIDWSSGSPKGIQEASPAAKMLGVPDEQLAPIMPLLKAYAPEIGASVVGRMIKSPPTGKDRYVESGGNVFDVVNKTWSQGPQKAPDVPSKIQEAIIAANGDPTKIGKILNEWNGRPLTNVTVPVDMRKESAFAGGYGTKLADMAAAALEEGDKAQNRVAQLDQLDALMNNSRTGRLAPAMSTVGAWAQAVGLDPTKLGVPASAAADSEGIRAITNAMTVGMIGTGGFPANNFSDADRKFLQQTMPQLSATPGGNYIITQAMRAAAGRSVQKRDAWMDAEAAGKTYSEFLRDWNKSVAKSPLFPVVQSAEEAQKLRPGTVFTDPKGVVRVRP